jgi:penicillin amidase
MLGKRVRRKILPFASLLLLAIAASGYALLRLSLPKLEGEVAAAGLSAPVTVARDARGTPTLTGRTRADLAFALGYLHGQERFFQMDLQRRSGAGELSELVGPAAMGRDRAARLHRFRHRAVVVLATATPEERVVLDAYVVGVNRGLGDLAAPPFEYLILRQRPAPWSAVDSMLVVYGMYLTLQESNGMTERRLADAKETLGETLASFLFPEGTSFDAALDGSTTPTPPTPAEGLKRAENAAPTSIRAEEPAIAGSNSFAVGGALSSRGAAIVENDMHLGLRAPSVWYRARLKLDDSSLDVTGVTLPGAPNVVTGSNGHVAWGFTNSQIDVSDVVILEPAEGDPSKYLTPDGAKTLVRFDEKLCATCAKPETLTIEESVWGPVIGMDSKGRKLVLRWIAHDPIAVNLRGALELERAARARAALDAAHHLGIPHQNIVVGDADGNVGWTVTSAIPRRFGHDGRTPQSWAEGDKGWSGYIPSHETPVILNPPNARIWTANARVVGGEALQKLGAQNYAHGSRAGQIRDALLAKPRFEEADLLAIALDDHAPLLDRWRTLLLQSLRSRAASRPELGDASAQVDSWRGRAAIDSIGYRLVRHFRLDLISSIYNAYMADMPALAEANPPSGPKRLPTNQADEPAWRLLSERPPQLVPPGYASWDAVVDAALAQLFLAIKTDAGGRLDAFTWGAENHTGIKHPLALALPALGPLLDPPDEPLPGDVYQPRVASPGYGASERFVVAPGHEATGLFHMPTGQSGHPLSPYYNLGHDDWVKGRPAPFLPGEGKWTLRFTPG